MDYRTWMLVRNIAGPFVPVAAQFRGQTLCERGECISQLLQIVFIIDRNIQGASTQRDSHTKHQKPQAQPAEYIT